MTRIRHGLDCAPTHTTKVPRALTSCAQTCYPIPPLLNQGEKRLNPSLEPD